MTVDINCQDSGVTGVRWRLCCGGLWCLLKAECLTFHPGDGEEGGWGLCLSGRNIFGEHTPGQGSGAQTRVGLSNQRVLIFVNQPRTHSVFTSAGEHTYLLLTTYSEPYGKSDRESNKLTEDNVSRRHHLFGDVFGFEGSPGISSTGYTALSAPQPLLYKHWREGQQRGLPQQSIKSLALLSHHFLTSPLLSPSG